MFRNDNPGGANRRRTLWLAPAAGRKPPMQTNQTEQPTLVEVNFPGGKRVDAKINGHVVPTDQKKHNGGQDCAPRPFETFLASIGACAGAYAMSYCERKSLPTKGLTLRLHCESDAAGRRVERITFEMSLPPDFPEKQIRSLERAVMGCAVKKHMETPPAFSIASHAGE
ncbi:MAG: putative redox protein [Desulfovibrionales bacterium]|nr:putative redox protein [Desulfovibrionales bacterium]